ncbi:MAG: hypothetical protein P8Q26_13990 [Ascidiaceihabitans sp.]|nr:hypothetical protein [Ascidiaceihabitans sp.]
MKSMTSQRETPGLRSKWQMSSGSQAMSGSNQITPYFQLLDQAVTMERD